MHRPGAAHAEHPAVPRAADLHRQPRRGRGGSSSTARAAPALAADRDDEDRAPRDRHGRRRRRRAPRRPAGAGLRDPARRRAAGRRSTPRTRTPPPRCATRAAPRATPRASSTRTARPCCTRWRWSAPTASGSASRTSRSPVVPMFHANAWGIAQAAPAAGAAMVFPGPMMQPEALADLIIDEERHLHRRRPDDLPGRPARTSPAATPAARDPLRRLGGAQALSEAYREQVGLPLQAWGMTETRPVASVGTLPDALRDADDDTKASPRARAAASRCSASRPGSSTPTPSRRSRRTTRPPASCRSAARGARRSTTTPTPAPSSPPPTAG